MAKRVLGGSASPVLQRPERREACLKLLYGIPTGSVGAIAEMLVSADLLGRGYHVFRSVSPCCPCDLIAMRAGEPPLMIEVKTGYANAGGVRCSPTRNNTYDVLAVVIHEEVLVVYDPPLESFAQIT